MKQQSCVNVTNDCLELQLHAPARDGAANEELLACLSENLRVKKSALRLRSGHKSPNKIVEVVTTMSAAEVIEALQSKGIT